jgi:hypothetical protein
LLRRQLAKLKTENIKLEVKIEEEEEKWFREVLKENNENGGGRRTIRKEDGNLVPTDSCFKIEKN